MLTTCLCLLWKLTSFVCCDEENTNKIADTVFGFGLAFVKSANAVERKSINFIHQKIVIVGSCDTLLGHLKKMMKV